MSTITDVAVALRGLAGVIRKYGTCAPAALDEAASRLERVDDKPKFWILPDDVQRAEKEDDNVIARPDIEGAPGDAVFLYLDPTRPVESGYVYRGVNGASSTEWSLVRGGRLSDDLVKSYPKTEFRRVYFGPILNQRPPGVECTESGCVQTDGMPCAYKHCPHRPNKSA